jgi:thiosulfate/3-mercaptopyruvate sulfurtransferase
MKLPAVTFAAALAFAAPVLAEAPAFGPLLSPAEFAAHSDATNPLILDIRTANGSDGRPAYEVGHVPDAVHAPYNLFRATGDNPGAVPDEARLTEVLRSLGVQRDRPTLIVHQGTNESDFGAAARVYWTLKSSGVSQLAILNGGFGAWVEDGFEVGTNATAPQPSDITVTFVTDWLATTDDVLAVVEGRDNALLLDARTTDQFEGRDAHQAAARPGTLPQARLFTHSGWFASGPHRIDVAAVRSIAAREGYIAEEAVVSFCNTGHLAATNWFALSEVAGLDNVRLYPDSMVGWSQTGNEMANTPGAFRNLLNQFR